MILILPGGKEMRLNRFAEEQGRGGRGAEEEEERSGFLGANQPGC